MFTLLLLSIQAAPASTPVADAAMQCGTAVIAASGEAKPSLQTTAQAVYFVMQAAKADPGKTPFMARVIELSASIAQVQAPPRDAAKAIVADCDRTYPLARATGPTARLPAKAFDRDLTCLGALSVLRGVAEEARERGSDDGAAARIDAALVPLVERFDDATLAAQGIAGKETFVAKLGEQLQASLMLGNLQTVAHACGVTGI